jgi:uncharacterized protein YjbI with pentapeptide repeats
MANEEHLKILKQGVKVWNRWREEHPEIRPIIDRIDLTVSDLVGVNLSGANLIRTTLSFSQMRNANLRRADLSAAVFISADLSHANLSDTKLIWTVFNHSSLDGVIFEQAEFGDTIISDTDLSNAIGLDTCKHIGPSTIDHRTLIKSGRLPLNFLRGCGLPDTLIEYLPSLLNDPIQFYSCFISYSSKDRRFAERLYADLQNKGVRCWFAPEDLKIGDEIRVRIDESIRVYDKLLLILSKESIASDWVEKEVETAMERERQQKRTILFPVRLDDEVLKVESGWAADIRRSRHIGDFRRWKKPESYQEAFDRLLRDLKAEAKKA